MISHQRDRSATCSSWSHALLASYVVSSLHVFVLNFYFISRSYNAFGSFRTLASLRGGDVASGGDGIPEFPTTSESFVPRYNGPPIDEMTDEQRTIRDDIIRTRPRTGISGPFGPWLAVPDIGRPSQELGRACRYGTTLSARESELIILLTDRRTAQGSRGIRYPPRRGAQIRSDAGYYLCHSPR